MVFYLKKNIQYLIQIVFLCFVVTFVASCTQKQKQLPCPEVSILSEGSSRTIFFDGNGKDITDIKYESAIERAIRTCTYKNSAVTVDTMIKIATAKGPRTKDKSFGIAFFVAVVDKKGNVVGRKSFKSILNFDKTKKRTYLVENIELFIPIRSDHRGLDYKVIVGFELTESELFYNREQRKVGNITILL